MIGIIVFLSKPLVYLFAFVVGTKVFKTYGPHYQVRPWLIVALATLARLALGVPGGYAAVAILGDEGTGVGFCAAILGMGFVLWLLTAKLAFRRAPLVRLVAFAAIAEVVSGTIDILAWHGVQSIRIC